MGDSRRDLAIRVTGAEVSQHDMLVIRCVDTRDDEPAGYRSGPLNLAHREFCLRRAEALSVGLRPEHNGLVRESDIDNLLFVAAHSRDISRMRRWPFTHQVIDMEALIRALYYFIASEMRTGKSKIVVDAAQFLFELGIIDKVLVVAPAPVRDVWYDKTLGEIAKHTWDNLPTSALEFHSTPHMWTNAPNGGKKGERRLDWLVTNYEFLSSGRLKQLAPFCGPRTLLVLDESSYVKTDDSARTKACKQLRRACGRVVLLNGTPIFHSPMDLFSQGNILHPSILQCKGVTLYRARYAVTQPVLGPGGEPLVNPWPKRKRQPDGSIKLVPQGITTVVGWTNLEDLQRRFAPCTVRRLQKDCLDLPPKLDPVILTATLTPETWRIYKSMRDELVVWLGDNLAATALTAAIKVLRLSQITGGFLAGVEQAVPDASDEGIIGLLDSLDIPGYKIQKCDGNHGGPPCSDPECWNDDFHENRGYLPPPAPVKEIGREKLDVLLWFLSQRMEADAKLKIVAWCRFRPELDRMYREVSQKFPAFESASIHGGQSSGAGRKERLRALALLKPETAPPGPVFVGGTYGTGSFGLDFTAAHTSISLSSGYSPGRHAQSADRVYGPGQTEPVAYFDIVAAGPKGQKTIDHTIVAARLAGEDLANWTASAWIKALKEE